jgi:MFS family permease
MPDASTPSHDLSKSRALRFIVALGVVSLFADMTYEGARSATGPFLQTLGASAAAVGFVAGLGELIGYALRLVSGLLSDRTKAYWTFTMAGYFVNLLAVPALALADRWEIAAVLIVIERTGKAWRSPARDAMLSHATSRVGQGWGFGLHEALDQIGAVTGPLIVTAVMFVTQNDYRKSLAALLVPALVALAVLVAARVLYPRPEDLEVKKLGLAPAGLSGGYWYYVAAAALLAAGLADFPLIAFHFKKQGVVPGAWIPAFYAIAMGVDAVAALIFARMYDRVGLRVMLLVAVISASFAPFVFLGGFGWALVGALLWGVSMGAQESIIRAAVGVMAPRERRGTAYGIFHTGYGLAWFFGSALMGLLYDRSIPAVIAFSVVIQLLSLPLFALAGKRAAATQSA